ncbi:MAG: preprotein translocase subunit YajC [Oscillospiraceae bacterium]|nr:preprotein translocase subunit YajC [Oscillospiraceae bacterium]
MNWEVILWTCITIAVLFGIFGIILYVISANNMRKRRKTFSDLHQNMKVGMNIIFSGGIYGKIVKIDEDTVDVEVSKGVVIKISRYTIQSEA